MALALAAAAPAHAAGSFQITSVPGEDALRVTGRIGPHFAGSIRAALVAHPATRVLIVRSQGGLLQEARKVATLLNTRGITVRADGGCASACAVLWAATDAREMTIDSRLGLHGSRWQVPLPAPLRSWVEKRSDRANVRVFLEAGFSLALAERAAKTPSSSMFWIGALELKHERVAFVLGGKPDRSLRQVEFERRATPQRGYAGLTKPPGVARVRSADDLSAHPRAESARDPVAR